MPVMDGVTATRLMREGGIALPVVGVTGNALEEDIRSFMNGGATEILVSPTAPHLGQRRRYELASPSAQSHSWLSLSFFLLCLCVRAQTKPVSTAQLSRVLQQYTHYRPTAAPSRAAPSTPVAGSRRGDAPS